MLPAYGLYGHIRNNNLKSVVLLATFAVYIALLWFVLCLIWTGLGAKFEPIIFRLAHHHQPTFAHLVSLVLSRTVDCALRYAFVPVVVVVTWFAIAFASHKAMIRAGTGARPIVRSLEFDLYNTVENLAITAGLPMPTVEIIETDALNAYASGLGTTGATIAVTRGLLETLNKDELEAVLAHEITHIKNRDVRLMVVAIIFVGILSYCSQILWRAVWDRPRGQSLGLPELVMFAVASTVAGLAYLFAVLSQLALSRTREFLADAGAAQLTKKPEALISALRAISGHDEIPGVPTSLRAMMISSRLEGLLATHPPVEDRIAALEKYAGAAVSTGPQPRHRGVVGTGRSALAAGRAGEAAHALGVTSALQPQVTFGRRKTRPAAQLTQAV
jgi:heat shock protein HtpX